MAKICQALVCLGLLLGPGYLHASYQAQCKLDARVVSVNSTFQKEGHWIARLQFQVLDFKEGSGHNPRHCQVFLQQELRHDVIFKNPEQIKQLESGSRIWLSFATQTNEIIKNGKVQQLVQAQRWQFEKIRPLQSWWDQLFF